MGRCPEAAQPRCCGWEGVDPAHAREGVPNGLGAGSAPPTKKATLGVNPRQVASFNPELVVVARFLGLERPNHFLTVSFTSRRLLLRVEVVVVVEVWFGGPGVRFGVRFIHNSSLLAGLRRVASPC